MIDVTHGTLVDTMWMIHALNILAATSTVFVSSEGDGIILPWRNQTKESRIIGGSDVSIS